MAKKNKKSKIEKKDSGFSIYTITTRKKNKKDGTFFANKSIRFYDHTNKKNISIKKISKLFDLEDKEVLYLAQTFPKSFEQMIEGMSFNNYDILLSLNNYQKAIDDFKIYNFGSQIVDFETFTILVDDFVKNQIESNDKENVPRYAIMGNLRFFIDKKNESVEFKTDSFEPISENTLIRRSLTQDKPNEIITLGS